MRPTTFAPLVLLFAGLAGAADDKNPAYTDPKEAGPDFAVQGEYRGQLGEHDWGAQVIALGDGKFDVVGFEGGLPGDGWKRGDKSSKGTGERKGDGAEFKGDHWTGRIEEGIFTVVNDEGEKLGELKKVERKSPTLGAKPPEGAIVLFDGTSADQFENGKLVEGNLLGATGQVSRHKFQDHTLHLEFRTPFMPKSRGQARGNSGMYPQGRYEVQILDSFGLDGADNECGGIYSINKPIVNACLPPLAWQTYDVEFTAARYEGDKKVKNARITVKHNGIVIHDDQELPSGTPGKDPEGPSANGLFLQDHGNPVAFRNIWAVEKK